MIHAQSSLSLTWEPLCVTSWWSGNFYSLTAVLMLIYCADRYMGNWSDCAEWLHELVNTFTITKKKTFDLTVPLYSFKHGCVMGREHFLLILMSPWIFWCAKFAQRQRLLQDLIVTEEKMVTGFPVRTICMVSSMIASWFSIARKCEELPLQRDVRPHRH